MNPLLQDNKYSNKCSFIKQNGQKCNSFAMKNSEYCYIHSDIVSDEEKRETRSKGGKKTVIVTEDVYDAFGNKNVSLKTPKDISKFLAKIINEILAGRMDMRLGTGLAFISNSLIKVLELTEIQERIETIEESLNNFKK